MKKLLSLAVALCLTFGVVLGATASTRPAFAEDTAEAQALLTKYYNGGYYTKATEIYQEGFPAYQEADFHAGASELVRRTEYTPGRLYMSNSEGAINSGYKDVDGNMAHFSIVEGQDVVDYTVKNTSVKGYFTDLEELASLGTWTKQEEKFVNTDPVWQWVHFIAPMWIGSTSELTKVVMYEAAGSLYLQLWSNTTHFAQAIVTTPVEESQEIVKTFVVSADKKVITNEIGATYNGSAQIYNEKASHDGVSGHLRITENEAFTFTTPYAGRVVMLLSADSATAPLTISYGENADSYSTVATPKNTIATFEINVNAGDTVTITAGDKKIWVHYVEYTYLAEGSQGGGNAGGGEVIEPGEDANLVETTLVHNFTESGKECELFEFSGNLASDKGSVIYNELTLTQCFKMETATSIKFTVPAGTLTLVVNNYDSKTGQEVSVSGKKIKIDGASHKFGDSGILVVELGAGTHSITKGDTMNIFYMSYTCMLCAEEHTVGAAATCTSNQVCTTCGFVLAKAYGHSGGTATCKDLAVCETCGASYGSLTNDHFGGTATCTSSAKCELCGDEYGSKLDHVDEDGDKHCDSCEVDMSTIVDDTEILTFAGTTKYDAGKLVHDENAIAAFSVKVLGGSVTVTANAATCDVDGASFANVLLPSGGSRSYEITANKAGTITIYFTVTDGSWGNKTNTVTFGTETLKVTTTKEKCYAITISVVAGETYTFSVDGNRLCLYAVQFN